MFGQGLDRLKDGLLSGIMGRSEEVQSSDVSWVGWSLGRGALATYGDSLGTGVDVKAGGWRMEDRGAWKHWPSTPASSVVLKENFHSQMFATQS